MTKEKPALINISSDAVRAENLQEMLRFLSFAKDDPALRVSVTGVYNPETENAVRHFQQTRRLPVTGIVDRAAWDAIANEYKHEQSLRRPPCIIPIPADLNYRTSLRERSDTVLLLQIILNALRIIYDYPQVPLSGVYNSQTANAVKHFQQINSLPPTGEADRQTWQKLTQQYNER